VTRLAAASLAGAALMLSYLATSRLQSVAFFVLMPLIPIAAIVSLLIVKRAGADTIIGDGLHWLVPAPMLALTVAVPLYLMLARRKLGWARAAFVALVILTGLTAGFAHPA